MTEQEAIKRIIEHCRIHFRKEKFRCPFITEALMMAVKALEKQIPKKPMLQECDFFDFRLVCPECKQPIVNVWNETEYKPNFCHYCGQKLDWSDENDKRNIR